MLRPEIQFNSTFPDDSVEDEEDILQWPGRNVAEALKAALEAKGYQVSEPIDAQFLGWELDIARDRKSFWVRISIVDEDQNYLFAENTTFFRWLGVKPFRAFLSDLRDVLEADARFSQLRWFAAGGISAEAAPASGPFDE